MRLAKLEAAIWLNNGDAIPASATALAGEMELLIPMAGLIDLNAEKQRLEKEIVKLQRDCDLSEKKLSNPGYTDKAPAEVVQNEREKLIANLSALEKLRQQLHNI